MYSYIQILYLILSTSALNVQFNVDLAALLGQNSEADTVPSPQRSMHQYKKAQFTWSDFIKAKDLGGEDYYYEFKTNVAKSTKTRKHKKRYTSPILTAFTTKYERGTTKRKKYVTQSHESEDTNIINYRNRQLYINELHYTIDKQTSTDGKHESGRSHRGRKRLSNKDATRLEYNTESILKHDQENTQSLKEKYEEMKTQHSPSYSTKKSPSHGKKKPHHDKNKLKQQNVDDITSNNYIHKTYNFGELKKKTHKKHKKKCGDNDKKKKDKNRAESKQILIRTQLPMYLLGEWKKQGFGIFTNQTIIIENKTDSLISNLIDNANKIINETKTHMSNIKNTADKYIDENVNKIKNKTDSLISQIKVNANKIKNETKTHIMSNIKNIADKYIGENVSKIKNQTEIHINKILNQFKNETSKHIKQIKNETETVIAVRYNNLTKTIKEQANNIKKTIFPVFNTTRSYYEDKFIGFAGEASKLEGSYFKWNPASIKVRDVEAINKFTERILNDTLRVLDVIRERNKEYYWSKGIKKIARAYEDKMKEFLRETKDQEIKTRHGGHKVILNAIEVSQRIVSRLMNMMTLDMDTRGLRTDKTQKIIDNEMKNEAVFKMKRACSELSICRIQNGIMNVIVDVLNDMLNLKDDDFRLAFDSITEAIQTVDFTEKDVLDKDLNLAFITKVKAVDNQPLDKKRFIVRAIKNIIVNRYTPVVIYSDSDSIKSNLNSTLCFLDILDTLDQKVPNTDENIKKWDIIRSKMKEIRVSGNNTQMQPTMLHFISHIKHVIDNLDKNSLEIIRKNARILFS